jgi:hypothetical protein
VGEYAGLLLPLVLANSGVKARWVVMAPEEQIKYFMRFSWIDIDVGWVKKNNDFKPPTSS